MAVDLDGNATVGTTDFGQRTATTTTDERLDVLLSSSLLVRRYNSFSIFVLEYIPVCFRWFSFMCLHGCASIPLFESLFWRMSVLCLLVQFFDFFSWFTVVIFFLPMAI